MSDYEDRAALGALRAEIQVMKKEFNTALEALISRIDSAMDVLLPRAADEKTEGVTRTKIKMGEALPQMEMLGGVGKGTSTLLPPVPKGKRACSVCRQPGHRASSCPNAHEIRAAEMSAHALREAAKKPKRNVKPLSEERKAQLREQLKKARASKGKK